MGLCSTGAAARVYCTTKDVQSLQWILPQVEAALQRFGEPSSMPHESVESC